MARSTVIGCSDCLWIAEDYSEHHTRQPTVKVTNIWRWYVQSDSEVGSGIFEQSQKTEV